MLDVLLTIYLHLFGYLFGVYRLEEAKSYCILVPIFIIYTSKVKCCDQSINFLAERIF